MFVLDRHGHPLMPCHPARARELLRKGRAVVARHTPFAIRLKDRTRAESDVDGVQLRIDPGSQGTGMALTESKKELRPDGRTVTARRGLHTVELRHRGAQIHKAMGQRAGYRHRRRSDHCRYRPQRSRNRERRRGWLPPSLQHRVDSTTSTARRLCRYAPVTEIHVESCTFDTHTMGAGRNLSSGEHRNGPLAGTDVRAHLRAKWDKSCAYCGATGVPLNIEHVRPRSRGGSNRVTNLVLACEDCNRAKGAHSLAAFLADRPETLAAIAGQLRPSLRDAAAMNAVRVQLIASLESLSLPVHCWSGHLTKGTRTRAGLAKTHTLDAVCVGPLDNAAGDAIVRVPDRVRVIKSTGRGSYARTTPDRFGFPRLYRSRQKRHHGFITGDLVRVTSRLGCWTGRVAVRADGKHSVTTSTVRRTVVHRKLRLLQRADGYTYTTKPEVKK
ncbi:RNA-guided endonuclease IscB [Streptomyces sp. NPDC001941]|uniref:RNA-guided endonuclease IscB n=1 Tax=Streptomyces sp. NPDC001941 TaxID=3154659 RepID=UPI0033312842